MNIGDLVINLIFLIEFCIKVIAKGLILTQYSCLRDNWIKLDFIILFVSLADNFYQDSDLQFFKVNLFKLGNSSIENTETSQICFSKQKY